MFRNKPTPEGQQLGELLARLCDDAEPTARMRMPELPPRCNSCAFRKGPHTANGSPTTQMDALKCIMECQRRELTATYGKVRANKPL